MRLKHKKIIQSTLDDYEGWTAEKDVYYKNNIVNFYKNGEISFSIEKIPKGKYMKTLYFITYHDLELEERVFVLDLCRRYRNTIRDMDVDWCIDFQSDVGIKGFLF